MTLPKVSKTLPEGGC